MDCVKKKRGKKAEESGSRKRKNGTIRNGTTRWTVVRAVKSEEGKRKVKKGLATVSSSTLEEEYRRRGSYPPDGRTVNVPSFFLSLSLSLFLRRYT